MGKDNTRNTLGTKEVFKNNKYTQFPQLREILDSSKHDITQLLSVRLDDSQYFIETKTHKYRITTQQGMDLYFSQYDKKKKLITTFTPYSDPGYEFFSSLVLAYYHFFKSAPLTSFPERDFEAWNRRQANRDGVMIREMQNVTNDPGLINYLFHENNFIKDTNGIYRFKSPHREETDGREESGLGFKDDQLILKIFDIRPSKETSSEIQLTIHKNLLNICMQAYIDANLRTAGIVTNLNVKKIQDALTDLLIDHAELRNDPSQGDSHIINHMRKTPLVVPPSAE